MPIYIEEMATLFDEIRRSGEVVAESLSNGLKLLSEAPQLPEVGLGISLRLDSTTGYFWWVWYEKKRIGAFGVESIYRRDGNYSQYWLRIASTRTHTKWLGEGDDHKESIKCLFDEAVLILKDIGKMSEEFSGLNRKCLIKENTLGGYSLYKYKLHGSVWIIDGRIETYSLYSVACTFARSYINVK